VGNLLLFILFPIFPRILVIFILASETNLMMHDVMREYFVDKEKYSYLILLHLDAAICIGPISLLAGVTLYAGYFKHICGIFRVASYRIEQAVIPFQSAEFSNELVIYKRLVHAIDIHHKGMKLCNLVTFSFVGSVFLSILNIVICLSLNLFALLQCVMFGSPFLDFMAHVTHIIVILLFMFLGNYFGQEITDHCNHTFYSLYNIQWYVAPLYIQKAILFVLQKGTRSYHIVFGGIFVLSMESAATLMSTSLSFFTVLYSKIHGKTFLTEKLIRKRYN
ncbi:hypothetical protein HN011_008605, partial [Eciton burchellii]